LYESIERTLTKNGYKKLIIWTLTDNIAAIYFYEAMGFVKQPWQKQFNFDNATYDEIAF
jgi:RimJ/RimL family protein N-acetyltransferase